MKKMKIIIAGAGEVGTHLAKMLSYENHNIIVIDKDETKLQYIRSHFETLTINGSVTSPKALTDANIGQCDLFISVSPTEELNLVSSIIAKNLGAKQTVARINNYEFLSPKNKEFFKTKGIDSIIYPEVLAARQVIGLLRQVGTTEKFEFTGGKLSLMAIKLDKNAPIINKTLKEASQINDSFDYRAVSITRNSKAIIPKGDDIFLENALVHVISNQAGISNLMKFSGKEQYFIKDIMILGGSRIGKRTARELQNNFNIKLIELDKEKCDLLADDLEKTTILNEDGTNMELLKESGIENMDAFIAVTENSETNILSCMLAKKLGVKKTIAEIENIDFIELAKSAGIDTIINKKLIAASHIFRFTMKAKVVMFQCLSGMDAEVLEFVVQPDSLITKKNLRNLNFSKDAIIGGVVRGDSSFIASGETVINGYDKVVVFAKPSAVHKIEKFFI